MSESQHAAQYSDAASFRVRIRTASDSISQLHLASVIDVHLLELDFAMPLRELGNDNIQPRLEVDLCLDN